MCGRFSFAASREKIHQQLPEVKVGENLRINYNIAPTQEAYVVTNDKPQELQFFIWGLLPFWSKEAIISGRLINARREGIETKPSFRLPIRRQRCLVLADSFYEWRKDGDRKIPYRIFPKDGSLATLAGVWDEWKGSDRTIRTFSIITAPPNAEVSPIHNRMPVVLHQPEQREKWLAQIGIQEVISLTETPPDGILDMYVVSDKVNSVRNNSPDLHQPSSDQLSLF
jgi:putative SOS response-associated peptidase YedK